MSLLWAQEGGYWKIIAIRIEDNGNAGILPNNGAAPALPAAEEPLNIAGDPAATQSITEFYKAWVVNRNVVQASTFASPRSYACLATPTADQKKLTPVARVQSGLRQPLAKIPSSANLSDMMSSMQPLNDLLRPVQQENSKAFAIMAVPDQKADSFLCQHRQAPPSFSGFAA